MNLAHLVASISILSNGFAYAMNRVAARRVNAETRALTNALRAELAAAGIAGLSDSGVAAQNNARQAEQADAERIARNNTGRSDSGIAARNNSRQAEQADAERIARNNTGRSDSGIWAGNNTRSARPARAGTIALINPRCNNNYVGPEGEVLRLLRAGEPLQAINAMKRNASILAKNIARLEGVGRYLDVFIEVPRFRFSASKWESVRSGYQRSVLVRDVLGSGNPELRNRWFAIFNSGASEMNEVKMFYLAFELMGCYKTYLNRESLLPFDIRDFEEKLAAVRASSFLQFSEGSFAVTVDRRYLLERVPAVIMATPPEQLKSSMSVVFVGEPGIDVGGPKREFFTVLGKALFNPDFALFNFAAAGDYALHIHPLSFINREHWNLYRFAGRFLGMAIFHRQLVGVRFCSIFLKGLLNREITLEDLQDLDRDVYNSIKQMRDQSVDDWSLTFSANIDEFDTKTEVELVPGGKGIDVTDENKNEYIALLVTFHAAFRTNEQMDLVRQGLFEIIPQDILQVFGWQEVQYLLSGSVNIDVADWKRNTQYESCRPTDLVATRFWDYVENRLSNQERADLLQFTTGSPCVPVTGFKDLQGSNGCSKLFTISYEPYNSSPTIVSHTCFNKISIPPHRSFEQFVEYMQHAIANKEGFGIA